MCAKQAGKSAARSSRKPSTRRKIQSEDLLRFEFVTDPQISPDGAHILFTKQNYGEKQKRASHLWTVATRGGKARQFTSGAKDGHGRWSPDGSKIAFTAKRDDQTNIYTIPATGGEATALTQFPEGSIRNFKWSPDGSQLAVVFRETEAEWTDKAKKERKENGASTPPRVIDDIYYRLDGDGYFGSRRYQIFLVDVATGKHRRLFSRDTLGFFSFDWSPDSSELVVAANTHPDAMLKLWKFELYRVDAKSGKARRIPNLPAGDKMSVCWSPDGRKIAYAGREGKIGWGVTNCSLFVCNVDGSNLRDLMKSHDYCLESTTLSDSADAEFDPYILWSPDSRKIVMSLAFHGETHVASIDAKGRDLAFHTKGRKTVFMGNLSDDGSQIALLTADQLSLPEVAVGRFSKPQCGGSVRISSRTAFNTPLLDELQLSPAEPHWIRSPEGHRIHAWLMKPAGFQSHKKHPAVLMIHGGPHCQYGEIFFHEMQVLAAAGYVVVYCNPRGSKGYGESHCVAIKGNWGDADWKDIQAVTAFMKEQSFVDSKQMGIAGGSYGGYMTNWAVGHTNEFAAAVTDRCVSNLISMSGNSDFPLLPGEYWTGNFWDDTEELWQQSPIKYFGNVETPLLVIHSEGDLRCNVEQSEQIFTLLKIRGIPTRLVRYPASTSHGMSRSGPPDLRIHRLGQYLDWWKQYLK